MSVYLIATLDTKGHEAGFLRNLLTQAGLSVALVDAGSQEEPTIAPDIDREEVFRAAGTTANVVRQRGDRGAAVEAAATGVAALIRQAYLEGQLEGVLGIGGSAGTTIATAAMRTLPLGVPKVMLSTLASGQVRPFVDGKDIVMINSVLDIAGLNRISRAVFREAAGALVGMLGQPTVQEATPDDKPLVAATMFGVTTPCIQQARNVLEQAGYEVLVFHATGNGGEAMEALIDDGLIAGVLDLTTTELADELVGGILSAGPNRLTAAGRQGVPQVISVGATDMVNFGPPETVPEKFQTRQFYRHNPSVTLMRTTAEECRQLGAEIAQKAAEATGLTAIMVPLRGVSAIDADGGPFDDPEARSALFASLREHHGGAELVEMDQHINDAAFAEAAARKLMDLMDSRR